MRFLADECVDREVVERLRTAGHEVKYVPESCPAASDEEILGLANSLNALLLTADKDFGYMVFNIRAVWTPDTDEVEWICPECGDQGVIYNWQGTCWDISTDKT